MRVADAISSMLTSKYISAEELYNYSSEKQLFNRRNVFSLETNIIDSLRCLSALQHKYVILL